MLYCIRVYKYEIMNEVIGVSSSAFVLVMAAVSTWLLVGINKSVDDSSNNASSANPSSIKPQTLDLYPMSQPLQRLLAAKLAPAPPKTMAKG